MPRVNILEYSSSIITLRIWKNRRVSLTKNMQQIKHDLRFERPVSVTLRLTTYWSSSRHAALPYLPTLYPHSPSIIQIITLIHLSSYILPRSTIVRNTTVSISSTPSRNLLGQRLSLYVHVLLYQNLPHYH